MIRYESILVAYSLSFPQVDQWAKIEKEDKGSLNAINIEKRGVCAHIL